jgi:hypothetical protein
MFNVIYGRNRKFSLEGYQVHMWQNECLKIVKADLNLSL